MKLQETTVGLMIIVKMTMDVPLYIAHGQRKQDFFVFLFFSFHITHRYRKDVRLIICCTWSDKKK